MTGPQPSQPAVVPPTTTAAGDDDYQILLTRLGARDRQAVEKHVAVCEAEATPEHADLWRRMAGMLARLAFAPVAAAGERTGQTSRQFGVQTTGQRALQFFAPDGKYRRQVFALEDLRDGVLVVYMVDALEAALKAGIVRGPVRVGEGVSVYELKGVGHADVKFEAVNAANLGWAPGYYRHMVGWNRSLLKMTVRSAGGAAHFGELEKVCTLAAKAATGK